MKRIMKATLAAALALSLLCGVSLAESGGFGGAPAATPEPIHKPAVPVVDEGGVDVARVPVKDSWKGDLTADYKTRYTYYFPNELETLGLPAEEASSGWGK